MISKRRTCFGFDSPSISDVATEDPGCVMWKPIPDTSFKSLSGSISETRHIVPHIYLNAITPRIEDSTDLGVDKAFMLMAPHNEVEKPWKKVFTYCIFGV